MRTTVASRVRPGDAVPPIQFHLGPNVVRRIDPDTATAGNLLITTTQGAVSFHPGEKVAFPRRPDGSRRDWWALDTEPLLRDLCVGDTLPPVNPVHPRDRDPVEDEQLARWFGMTGAKTYDDLPSYVRAEIEQTYWMTKQEVVSIWPIDSLTWGFSCYEPEAQTTRNFRGHTMVPVSFPRDTISRVRPEAHEYDDDGTRVVYSFGVYMHKRSEHLFLFAEHPYGRGRWPKDIKNWDEVDPEEMVVIARPPRSEDEWSYFSFQASTIDISDHALVGGARVRFEHHPKDPRAKRKNSGGSTRNR